MAYGAGQANPPQPNPPAGQDPASVWYAGALPPPGAGMNPSWLASNADRERTVGVLRAGFTEGRLTQDELDDRVARAYAARTYADLWALTADLPAGALPYPVGPQAPVAPHHQPGPPDHWRSAAALVITALVIFTLAALVTAIATAHAQPVPFGQFQHVHLTPFIRGADGPGGS